MCFKIFYNTFINLKFNFMDQNFPQAAPNQEKKKLSCCQKIIFILLLPLIILFIIPIFIFLNSRINKIQKQEVMEAALTLGFSKIEDLQDEKAFDKIKKNYKTLALKFSPDKQQNDLEIDNDKQKYTSVFQSINAAKAFFGDKEEDKEKIDLLKTINKKEFEKARGKFNAGKFKDENNSGSNIFESIIQDKEKEIKISDDILKTDAPQEKQTSLEKIAQEIKIVLKNIEQMKKQNQETSAA